MQVYSNPDREDDAYALPDVEVFQLTATEVAEMDEDNIYEFMKRNEFRLAGMNSCTRNAMLDTMVEELGIEGGWFSPFGPYATEQEAKQAAIDDSAE